MKTKDDDHRLRPYDQYSRKGGHWCLVSQTRPLLSLFKAQTQRPTDRTSWKTGTLQWVNCVRCLLFTNSYFLGLISDSRHGYSKLIVRRLQFPRNWQRLVSSMHQNLSRFLWHCAIRCLVRAQSGRGDVHTAWNVRELNSRPVGKPAPMGECKMIKKCFFFSLSILR